jgi:hypothetical protein
MDFLWKTANEGRPYVFSNFSVSFASFFNELKWGKSSDVIFSSRKTSIKTTLL